MNHQWNGTRPVQTASETLLDRALQYCVKPGRACDTGHLVLAALLYPDYAGLARAALAQIDGPTRERVIGGLLYALEEDAALSVRPGELTMQLQQCVADWQPQIANVPAFAVDAIMLRTVLTKDDRLSRFLQIYGIDAQQIASELASPYAAPMPPFTASWPWAYSSRPSHPQLESDAYVLPVVQRLTKVFPTSPGLVYSRMHNNRMTAFVDELAGTIQSGKILLLTGRYGSPASIFPQVLADRLAAKFSFTQAFPRLGDAFDPNAPLNAYGALYHLNLRHACEQAAIPGMPEPYRILEVAMQHARQNKAILLLEELDVLAAGSEIAEHVREPVRAVLNCAPEGLVFALYITHGEQVPEFARDWGLTNLSVARVHHYTPEHTRESIKRHYLPLWEQAGYTFAPDAFDWVIALEPGAWVSSQRETLPYLAVDLAHDAMRTAADGDWAIRETAQSAIEAIDWLLGNEAPRAAARDQYSRILQDARRELLKLTSATAPLAKNGRTQLTRAHLAAQLLCRSRCEFHYPGFTPLGQAHV